MENLTIRIYKAESEDGYFYDIYDTDEWTEDSESIDGGLCTTTIKNALEMATSQARELIANYKK